MSPLKSLPARPSLESLRKQARRLAREVADADAPAIARMRAQLPGAELPLTLRNAQLVLAREYGFAGWAELTAEALKRSGRGLEWAVAEAERLIHDNDVGGLKRLLAEHPALLSWRAEDDDAGVLGMATSAFGDCFDPDRERHFTRHECAEVLLDAGAVVLPGVGEGIIRSRAKGLLGLFQSRGLLPRTLPVLAALGDFDAVRACFDERGLLREGEGSPAEVVTRAFVNACKFEHEGMATFLLDRCIDIDAGLGRNLDDGPGRAAFVRHLMENTRDLQFDVLGSTAPNTLWRVFFLHEAMRFIHDNDLAAFTSLLHRAAWLLDDAHVSFQVQMIERATLHDRGELIGALLDHAPALLQRRPPPTSQALEFAFEYAHAHLVPLLTRVWPLPDDLPHAAGMGDLERVKRWFDGAELLGDLADHCPGNDPYKRTNLHWGEPTRQQVLDTALAWAVMNHRFEVADFLLAHGADINTRWSTHEPASILHELVFHEDYEAMQFLIDRGIDLTILDYRWNATAAGWAYHAANNPRLCGWLMEAEERRKAPGESPPS